MTTIQTNLLIFLAINGFNCFVCHSIKSMVNKFKDMNVGTSRKQRINLKLKAIEIPKELI